MVAHRGRHHVWLNGSTNTLSAVEHIETFETRQFRVQLARQETTAVSPYKPRYRDWVGQILQTTDTTLQEMDLLRMMALLKPVVAERHRYQLQASGRYKSIEKPTD